MISTTDFDKLQTEQENIKSRNIDEADTATMLKIINDEDKKAILAVEKALPEIAAAVELIARRLKKGGRLFYIGSGTSGRLGVLDAVECPPTYGTDPNLIVGLIAGGYEAIFRAKEGAEDDFSLAAKDLAAKNLSKGDVVAGIAASGRTPYVIGGLKYAGEIGAARIAISCVNNSELKKYADINIEAATGGEAVTGSTRMKAGTAQKTILNMLSTGAMIKLGKVYGNLMVDVKATNEKLKNRARRIVEKAANVDATTADALLKAADGNAKTAIFMHLAGLNRDEARSKLDVAGGNLKRALRL